jgi:hypothetical protein
VLAAPFAILACRSEPRQQVPAASEAGVADSASDASRPLRTGDVQLTVKDGILLRDALLALLRSSNLPDREELLKWTENASLTMDPDGVFRIGRWILGEWFGSPALTYRLRRTEAALLVYVAPIVQENGHPVVKSIDPVIVHARR